MVSLLHVFLCALFVAVLVPERALEAATSCTAVANLSLRGATITLAAIVEPGAFTPPAPGAGAQAYRTLPSFCRVAATLRPTRDSDIRIEVWMPAAGWNGKLRAVGNGAFNGAIAYQAPGSDCRLALHQRRRGPYPATVSVPAASRLQGSRKQRRSGKLRLSHPSGLKS
jgi:hypothetical protein